MLDRIPIDLYYLILRYFGNNLKDFCYSLFGLNHALRSATRSPAVLRHVELNMSFSQLMQTQRSFRVQIFPHLRRVIFTEIKPNKTFKASLRCLDQVETLGIFISSSNPVKLNLPLLPRLTTLKVVTFNHIGRNRDWFDISQLPELNDLHLYVDHLDMDTQSQIENNTRIIGLSIKWSHYQKFPLIARMTQLQHLTLDVAYDWLADTAKFDFLRFLINLKALCVSMPNLTEGAELNLFARLIKALDGPSRKLQHLKLKGYDAMIWSLPKLEEALNGLDHIQHLWLHLMGQAQTSPQYSLIPDKFVVPNLKELRLSRSLALFEPVLRKNNPNCQIKVVA